MPVVSLADEFRVLIDTCALYPAHLRDTLLRLSERGLYRVLWSDEILAELERALKPRVPDASRVDHLISQMRRACPEAAVHSYEHRIDAMTCDSGDKHVLAAAVEGQAEAIITFNTDDFPPESTNPHGIDVLHPDDFLLDLHDLYATRVEAVLSEQAADNRKPPQTTETLLDALQIAGAPKFAAVLRSRLAPASTLITQ